ncbi:hypothetical protein Tco_1033328 [Tanacetum coccineum]|uniref:Uncharacterized protein n=1 Tax=Tanacetum coccineum TaxID=301880 RepID=A0ABQ5GEC3_9ASTR
MGWGLEGAAAFEWPRFLLVAWLESRGWVFRNDRLSLLLNEKDVLQWASAASPLESSVLLYASSDQTKSSNLSIISFTIAGTLS